MITVNFGGGLGNILFQLAAAETLSLETGRPMCISRKTANLSPHSSNEYFSSLLNNWANYPLLQEPYTIINEPSYKKHDWKTMLNGLSSVRVDGFFQNWEYVQPSFVEKLKLPACEPLNGAFIHIRGGDYRGHPLLDVGLGNEYYRNAVKHFPGAHFYIFTNDIAYARSFTFLQSIPHTFVNSDELISLAQMSSCTRGGICANSSFSWWGAFLSPNRTLVMPDKWFNNPTFYAEGLYFPGVIRCAK